jgi:hypothetical protein
VQIADDVKEDLLVHHLRAMRDVGPLAEEIRIFDVAFGAEQLRELGREHLADLGRPVVPGHLDALVVVPEVVEVELEASAVRRTDHLAQLLDVFGFAVGGEPHHLPFLAVAGKPEELRDRRVEQAGGVGKFNPIDDLELAVAPHAPHRRHEVAEPVDRQAGRLLERRDEERARDVRLVMLDAVELCPHGARLHTQRLGELAFDPPHLGDVRETVLDDLRERRPLLDREQDLLVQVGLGIARHRDVIDVARADAAALQHRADRERRKPGAVLAPVETLLFDRRDEQSVFDEHGGSVAVKRVDTQNVHRGRTL